MSTLARELNERLQRLDAQTAAHVERLVREVLALTETALATAARGARGASLTTLAACGEPMGAMTNADIDRAVYGE